MRSVNGARGRRRAMHRLALAALGPTALSSISACTFGAGPDHTGKSAPRARPLPAQLQASRPFTLVLSSGGPRGFVHVGVIQALDELGVRPGLVVGASVGALIGTLYCSAMSGDALYELALSLGPTKFASLAIGTSERFSGAPIASRVNSAVDNKPLEQLQPRCAVIALDRASGKTVAFTEGNAGVAVQASAAVPGRFVPVSINSRQYVDPDLVAPLPVRIARQLGAGRVLSVDASAHEDNAPAGADGYRAGDLRKRALTKPDAHAADLNLHPEFGYWVSFSAEFRKRAMRSGYEHTMRHADQIRALAAPARNVGSAKVGKT